jgi:hypothetical protein
MSSREEKKLIPVSADIANRALALAKRKMTSISNLTEEALNLIISLEEKLNLDAKSAYSILNAIKTLRVLGGAFLPRHVVECLLDENCRSSKDRLLNRWYESGRLYGTYLRDSSSRDEAIKVLLENLRWDFSEVSVTNEGDQYRVRCIATSMSGEETEQLVKFLEGLIEGLMCRVENVEFIRGLIVARFKC